MPIECDQIIYLAPQDKTYPAAQYNEKWPSLFQNRTMSSVRYSITKGREWVEGSAAADSDFKAIVAQ
jgi:hypothetical protein